MNNRLHVWREWVRAYWDRMEEYPELFPLLCRMYFFDYYGGRNMEVAAHPEPAAEPPPATGCSACGIEGDVLFVAQSARENCLGVIRRLIQQLQIEAPGIRSIIFQTRRNVVVPPAAENLPPVITYQERVCFPCIARLLRLMGVIWLEGMKVPRVRKCICRHPVEVMLHAVKILIRFPQIQKLLADAKVKMVVAPNEVTAEASLLFPVARRMGIKTVQYLHGTPNRLFVPFISDEFWVWSEVAGQMLTGDRRDGRVVPIGSLEHSDCAVMRSDNTPAGISSGPRILFLSQIKGDQGWQISAFGRAAERVARIVSAAADTELRVRQHPHEGDEEHRRLEEIFKDTHWQRSSCATSLDKDIAWATHIYTASSTGILAGLAAGKPCYLLWDDELDDIHRRPFFPEDYVVRTDEQMRRSLSRAWSASESQSILTGISGTPGSLQRAVQRIKQIAGSC